MVRLTRRDLLAGAAAGAVGAAGVYELVDHLAGAAPSRAAVPAPPAEQHLLEGVRVVRSDGIEVLVPPLHHEVLTARVSGLAATLDVTNFSLDTDEDSITGVAAQPINIE